MPTMHTHLSLPLCLPAWRPACLQVRHYLGHSYVALNQIHMPPPQQQQQLAAAGADGSEPSAPASGAAGELGRVARRPGSARGGGACCPLCHAVHVFNEHACVCSTACCHPLPACLPVCLSAGWAGLPGQREGAQRNFGLVQGVVQSLGGIPAMVSGGWGWKGGAAMGIWACLPSLPAWLSWGRACFCPALSLPNGPFR
jgi:hypothetical protein